MPIDRAWYNALVDDDGSGQVGTVWNKAAINGLLNSIDLLFPARAAWTPTITTNEGYTINPTVITCKRQVIGDLCFWRIYTYFNLGVSSSAIRFTTAPIYPVDNTYDETLVRMYVTDNSQSEWGYCYATSNGVLEVHRQGEKTIPPGTTVYIIGTGFFFIR